jgi:hypothetical protein
MLELVFPWEVFLRRGSGFHAVPSDFDMLKTHLLYEECC